MGRKISRRTFAKITGAAALASATPSTPANQPSQPSQMDSVAGQSADRTSRTFPKGFIWGTATAAYQVEGAVKEDGRGPSIWDTFSHTPGKVVNNATGDVADDHYHLYKGDVQLMKALGVRACRFSIAWSRVFPEGTGRPNPKGLDFYNRLVDELLANNIQPFATLYHWDLPHALQTRVGGWESRDTSKAFADYAGYVAERLTDRIKHIFTINEFGAFVELGYRLGIHAPGLKLPPGRFNQTRHHAVLGHGLAVQAIRAKARRGTKVGLAENITVCVPVVETPQHIEAAVRATREMNAQYMTVIQEGKYTDAYLAAAGSDAPKFTPEDLKIISSTARLRRHKCLHAAVRACRRLARGLRRRAAPCYFPAHGFLVAVHRAGGALLGAAPCCQDMERQRNLHNGERFFFVGYPCAGRYCL